MRMALQFASRHPGIDFRNSRFPERETQLSYILKNYSDQTCREIFSKQYYINPKSDCIYHFPVDLNSSGRPFGSKSIPVSYCKWHFKQLRSQFSIYLNPLNPIYLEWKRLRILEIAHFHQYSEERLQICEFATVVTRNILSTKHIGDQSCLSTEEIKVSYTEETVFPFPFTEIYDRKTKSFIFIYIYIYT